MLLVLLIITVVVVFFASTNTILFIVYSETTAFLLYPLYSLMLIKVGSWALGLYLLTTVLLLVIELTVPAIIVSKNT